MPHNNDSIRPPGPGSTSVYRGQTCAYVIESSSKPLIDSIYGLFFKYDRLDVDVDVDVDVGVDAAVAGQPGFTMTLNDVNDVNDDREKYAIHVSGTLNREKTRRSLVTCQTLADRMADQTVATANDQIVKMLEMIQEQMWALEGLNRLAVPYYGLDDILVINGSFFCFFNDDKLFTIDPDTHLMGVSRPIGRGHAFYAPELEGRLHALPYTVDYRASLYSLGMLAAFCALMNWDLVVNPAAAAKSWRTYSESELVSMLDPIKYSKLYWFVLRCCRTDVKRRLCVFV